MIVFWWIVLSIVIGIIGSYRKIDGARAFLISLLLSPIIGFIVVLSSKSKKEEEYEKKLLKVQRDQTDTLDDIKESLGKKSVADELERIKRMKDEGLLTEVEFQSAKGKILSS
jgi:hypothetical protein